MMETQDNVTHPPQYQINVHYENGVAKVEYLLNPGNQIVSTLLGTTAAQENHPEKGLSKPVTQTKYLQNTNSHTRSFSSGNSNDEKTYSEEIIPKGVTEIKYLQNTTCHTRSFSPGSRNNEEKHTEKGFSKRGTQMQGFGNSINQTSSISENSNDDKKHSKSRITYSAVQIVELEKEFRNDIYVDRIKRAKLAKKLSLSERQIKVWFQNKRVKLKKSDQDIENVPAHLKCCSKLSEDSSDTRDVVVSFDKNDRSCKSIPEAAPKVKSLYPRMNLLSKNSVSGQNTQYHSSSSTSRSLSHASATQLNSSSYEHLQPVPSCLLPTNSKYLHNQNFSGYSDYYHFNRNWSLLPGLQNVCDYYYCNIGKQVNNHHEISLVNHPAWDNPWIRKLHGIKNYPDYFANHAASNMCCSAKLYQNGSYPASFNNPQDSNIPWKETLNAIGRKPAHKLPYIEKLLDEKS